MKKVLYFTASVLGVFAIVCLLVFMFTLFGGVHIDACTTSAQEAVTETVPATPSDMGVERFVRYGKDCAARRGELALVSDIVWLESRGTTDECIKATAEVIFNRVKSGIWGDSITDVIYAVDPYSGYWEFSTVPLLDTVERDYEYYHIARIVADVFVNGCDIPARVMWFRTGYYHEWANDEFSIGNVYFSSSPWVSVGEL